MSWSDGPETGRLTKALAIYNALGGPSEMGQRMGDAIEKSVDAFIEATQTGASDDYRDTKPWYLLPQTSVSARKLGHVALYIAFFGAIAGSVGAISGSPNQIFGWVIGVIGLMVYLAG